TQGGWHGTDDPAADARVVAGARGSVRGERCVQRLLVHVLEDRQRLSPAAARKEPGGVPAGGGARSAAGPARVRGRSGRGLVPADAARRPALARSYLAPEAGRRRAGLV